MRPLSPLLLLISAMAAPAFAQSFAFSNQTAASGINNTYQPGTFSSSEYIGPGACGDFNNDGWQDVFLLSGGQTNGPDRLYMNQCDGTFLDRAAQWALSAVHRGTGIAVGDYNNDGFLDTYVTSVGVTGAAQAGQNKLYKNQNGLNFVDLAVSAGVNGAGAASDPYGASFGDYDLDGHLDLFVGGFYTHKSRLYHNQGNGTFVDATVSSNLAGPGLLGAQFVFGSRFADMDGDRYPELLVMGDFGSTRYYRNNQNGTFTNLTAASGTGKEENGMGHTVGDFNRDGRLDWYVTSIFDDTPSVGWTGNKIYRNNSNHSYTEYSSAAGVGDGGYGWAAVSADFDHDRWLDIAETNGAAWSNEWKNEPAYMWRNLGNNTFSEVSQASGFVSTGLTRGLIQFDYDLDGDQDLLVLGTKQPAELWRNDLQGPNKHWLRVSLDPSDAANVAPNGYGSVVRVTAGGVQQTGHVFGGDNFQSQNELTAHFGLADQTLISELRVEWPDGVVTTLNNVSVDQHITVTRSPWTDLGGGIPGTFGPISLSGTGSLAPSSPTTISVQGATPNSSGLLFVGVSPLNAPLYGGIFWPTPQVQVTFPTNAAGELLLNLPWPATIPSGISLWMQAWFSDPGGTFGAAASNGLRATTP